jgi:hypothetical protein
LEIRVRAGWETIVHPADREYLQSLFEDFKERSAVDPLALFKQASSLGVGPLIARDVVSNIETVPDLANFLADSIPL